MKAGLLSPTVLVESMQSKPRVRQRLVDLMKQQAAGPSSDSAAPADPGRPSSPLRLIECPIDAEGLLVMN